MSQIVHPLQEKSLPLFRSLYEIDQLPLTNAMLSATNERYAPLKQVLGTLDNYKDIPRVQAFLDEYAELVKQARYEAANQKDESKGLFDYFPYFNVLTALDAMKTKSLTEIEETLSQALSELCGENLVFEIKALQQGGSCLQAELVASIKLKLI